MHLTDSEQFFKRHNILNAKNSCRAISRSRKELLLQNALGTFMPRGDDFQCIECTLH